MAQGNFFRTLRITVLLLVLFFVALGSWLAKVRSTDWNDTLWVAVHPIDGDGSTVTRQYIDTLRESDFDDIQNFMAKEANRYGVSIEKPVHVVLAATLDEIPPLPPADRNALKVIFWSLNLRFWASRQDNGYSGPDPDIRIFVVYHDPDLTERVAHSLGLQKGLIGVVNAWAGRRQAGGNSVVIAHEMLHTLGATDKYDSNNLLPQFPEGYADPEREPRHPQSHAEIMGGRIPLSSSEAKMPSNLRKTLVGTHTASEIRWRSR